MTIMQRLVGLIYPSQCAYCTALVDEHGGLCADCWRDAGFITGHKCESCALPLLGSSDGHVDYCDDCRASPRPWSRGRAALAYEGIGRRLVLALKYGDRTDIAWSSAKWMTAAGADILRSETLIVPVPSHWRRLASRRYNPAVELGRAISVQTGLDFAPDALVRNRATPTQEGLGRDDRLANIDGAMSPHPRRGASLKGRHLCIVDDTMTSGATLSAATQAALEAVPATVSVLVLARAGKTP